MINVIEQLFALHQLHFTQSSTAPSSFSQKDAELRAQIPESFLRVFDRFLARKMKPVALVRNGVCTGCHIQVAVGTLGNLAFGQGVQQCGNCGRFLFLPKDEPAFASKPSKSKKRIAPKETAGNLA